MNGDRTRDPKMSHLSPKRVSLNLSFGLLIVCLLSFAAAISCKRTPSKEPTEVPKVPDVRFYLSSTLAGAMEPCGCRKDMLGGVDHAAAMLAKGKQEAPNSVVLGAGPLFFLNPELTADKRQQDLWKAHGIAASLADMGLAAWSPGVNDLAAGSDELARLKQESRAALLAANLQIPGVPTEVTRIIDVGKRKVGIAGVVDWEKAAPLLGKEVKRSDPQAELQKARDQLRAQGADILVALISAPRGKALRLAEAVDGFQLAVVGKPLDRGEGNDAPTPPITVGDTLVVEAPNHLQSIAVVDLFVAGDDLSFNDGSGIEAEEKKRSLQRRIAELTTRLAVWKERGKFDPKDVKARQADLDAMKKEFSTLEKPRPTPEGSFFRYDLRDVRESNGSNEQVLARMRGYYKQVNEYNREAFKDRKPEPVGKGQPAYAGAKQCVECHEEAYEFWTKTGHARAYATLEVDFKEFNLDCVSCHVTGYEKPGGSTVTFVEGLKDVQCEACHGPGTFHVKEEDTDLITLTPDESVCKKCHHAPHVADDWDVKEAWRHIIGKGHGDPGDGSALGPTYGGGGAANVDGHGGGPG